MQLGIDTESFHLAFQNKQMDIFSFIDEFSREKESHTGTWCTRRI